MGQYYSVYTKDASGEIGYSIQPQEFEDNKNFVFFTGYKLMEHAWIGTHITDFISDKIYKNPTRLGWVGDYAEDSPEKEIAKQDRHYHIVSHFDYRGKWAVNHSKKTGFLFDISGDSIYPIALLTADGNGEGGGDYFGPQAELAGSWKFDIISIDDFLPEGYTKVEQPCFAESE